MTSAELFGRARTIEITDADRGRVDYDRGLDLRFGLDPVTRRYVRHERSGK